MRSPPDHASLLRMLRYVPETGYFIWTEARNAKVPAGTIAGTRAKSGYVHININGFVVGAHRLAWFYMTGEWPTVDVEHRNGLRWDNEWGNLRLATRGENMQNVKLSVRNKSGLRGVSRNANGKWRAQIATGNNKTRYLGLFDTPEDAHEAYMAARATLFTFQPIPRDE